MSQTLEWLNLLIERGGPVMYPLFGLSVISLALILERSWFWLSLRRKVTEARLQRLNAALRKADRRGAAQLSQPARTPYDRLASALLNNGSSDAAALEAVQMERPRVERFMLTLSTIITAAPLLGILGTVAGIIQSFELLGEQAGVLDPKQVSGGIAQALITTAAGLIIALFTIFPYMAFRVQVDRAINRMESLIASAQEGDGRAAASPAAKPAVPSTSEAGIDVETMMSEPRRPARQTPVSRGS